MLPVDLSTSERIAANRGGKDCLVVAPTTTGRLSIMFAGTRSQCCAFIRRRVRLRLPTHFCYVVTDSDAALKRLKKQLGL